MRENANHACDYVSRFCWVIGVEKTSGELRPSRYLKTMAKNEGIRAYETFMECYYACETEEKARQ